MNLPAIPTHIVEVLVFGAVLQVLLVALLGLNFRFPFIECVKFILLSWFGMAAVFILFAALA
jgi:hypothetical protein